MHPFRPDSRVTLPTAFHLNLVRSRTILRLPQRLTQRLFNPSQCRHTATTVCHNTVRRLAHHHSTLLPTSASHISLQGHTHPARRLGINNGSNTLIRHNSHFRYTPLNMPSRLLKLDSCYRHFRLRLKTQHGCILSQRHRRITLWCPRQ